MAWYRLPKALLALKDPFLCAVAGNHITIKNIVLCCWILATVDSWAMKHQTLFISEVTLPELMLKSTTELNKICCQLTCFLLLIIMLPSHDLLLTCLARTYYVSALLSSALIRMIKIKYKLSIMRQLSFNFLAGLFIHMNCADSRFRPIWIKLV